ncbi:tRNA (32-2'-O)-methyltransferase regulator THADA-like isoform X2 [Styela clava]
MNQSRQDIFESSHLSTLPQCALFLGQIEEELENENISTLLHNLKFAENDGKLLQDLRNVGSQLMNIEQKPPDCVLNILVKYFIIANSKHPFKRAVVSVLQKVKNPSARKRIIFYISNGLNDLINTVKDGVSVQSGRHIIDVLLACLENFSLGIESLKDQSKNVLCFIDMFLGFLLLESNNTNVGLDNLHFDVAITLKCCVSIIKKCISMDPSLEMSTVKHILHHLVTKCQEILASGHFSWECYSAAGMTWIIIWNTIYKKNILITKIKKLLNGMVEYSQSLNSNDDCIIDSPIDKYPIGIVLSSNVFAALSFCNGALTMVHTDDLVCVVETQDENCKSDIDATKQKSILVDDILHFMYIAEVRCESISSQVVASKCFVQWTCTILNASKKSSSKSLKQLLFEKKSSESESVVEKLFNYSLDKLEHPTDAIRHQANDMLSNLLQIGTNLGNDEFAKHLVQNVLSQSWEKRSTYTALNRLLQHVCTSYVMEEKPDIHMVLLTAMKHQSLAPYASETYKLLANKSTIGEETKMKSNESLPYEEIPQNKIALDTMLSVMCETTSHHLRLLVDYCFIKLLRVNGKHCVSYIMNEFLLKLSSKSDDRKHNFTQTLAAFLACFRAALLNGYLKNDEDLCGNSNSSFLQNFLNAALIHQDSEIRQLGFSLFCESVKPSNLISRSTLNALQHAIPFNVSSQDPAFRQWLLNSMKKFLIRLKGNMLQLMKVKSQVEMKEENNATLLTYSGFVTWLGIFCISQLYTSAPYAKRVTSISLVKLITNTFSDSEFENLVKLDEVFTPDAINILFDLLSDSYEDVKQISFHLLTNAKLRGHVASAISLEKVSELTLKAMYRAARSSKPEWCGDAAYHLRLCAVLGNTDVTHSSVELLRICTKLSESLNEGVLLAEKNLFLAATSSPMYGILHCIKCLLKEVNFKNMNNSDKRNWHELISRIVDTCFQVTKAVLPVVGSVSPEGLLPDITPTPVEDNIDGGPDDGWNELPDAMKSLVIDGNNSENFDEMKTRALAQTVLICCWRSAKESALLLQEITSSYVPLDSSNMSSDGVLSWKQLQDIGDHLLKQLMGARHRGAFEIAYSAFKACCARLWSIEHTELSCIPEKWLHSILLDIEDPSRSKDLCATRRSAGLPFFIQALLSGNKSTKGKKHLHLVMSKLLSLCNLRDETSLVPKVHSLNVLRGLIKDSSLGEEILPYVSQCTQVSIIGFASSVWAVRNSSTLLFSALVTRIFGVKRDKNDYFCMKNRLSANEFFSRLQGLHSFLLQQLEKICNNLDKGSHHALCPTLHPILLLLSRIYPSTMQPTSGISLTGFIPLLIRCRASAVYKSRVSAAVALASVLTWDRRINVMKICCDNLKNDAVIVQGKSSNNEGIFSSAQNRIHGGLLQISEILNSEIRYNQLSTANLRILIDLVISTLNELAEAVVTKKNNCPLTRSTAVQLFIFIRDLKTKNSFKDTNDWNELLAVIKHSSLLELESVTRNNMFDIPGYSFLLQSIAQVLVLLCSNRLSELLPLLEKVFSTVNYDIIDCVVGDIVKSWDKEIAASFNSEDAIQFEEKIVQYMMERRYNFKITELMYDILNKLPTCSSANKLFQRSMDISESCNPSQSSYLRTLINFQSKCMKHLISSQSKMPPDFSVIVDKWIKVLSSACQSYENSDDVRLAVANSISENAEEVLLDPGNKFGFKSVDAWIVVFTLLCDEEVDIRKVASTAIHLVSSEVGKEKGYPSVDTRALQQAALTLILTHGRRHTDACRHALQNLARSQSKEVPISVTETSSNKK